LQEDIDAAVGNYADYGPMDFNRSQYGDTTDVEKRKGWGPERVKDGYGAKPQLYVKSDKERAEELARPIDLSSAEDRLKFLNGFTQQGADDKNSGDMCGPTSLIGGAILANGAQGVGTLLDAVDKMSGGNPDNEAMQLIRAKLDPANPMPLTGRDLQDAQKYIYEQLNKHEGLDVNDPEAMKKATTAQRGVGSLTMQDLLKDKELGKMFKDNKLEIANMDLGGDNGRTEDHAVLRQYDADNKTNLIFDPGQRKNGQVTGRPEGWTADEAHQLNNGIADYDYAQRGGIRPS